MAITTLWPFMAVTVDTVITSIHHFFFTSCGHLSLEELPFPTGVVELARVAFGQHTGLDLAIFGGGW